MVPRTEVLKYFQYNVEVKPLKIFASSLDSGKFIRHTQANLFIYVCIYLFIANLSRLGIGTREELVRQL